MERQKREQDRIKELESQLESSAQTNADLTVRLSEEIEKRNKLEAKLEEAKELLYICDYQIQFHANPNSLFELQVLIEKYLHVLKPKPAEEDKP